jgi:hypothetical protein
MDISPLSGHISREEIEALQAAHGKRVVTASGFTFRSTWYEHPFRNSRGRLRSWADCERIARKVHRENVLRRYP